MSHELQPKLKEQFTEGLEMQQFMTAEVQVLSQLFGEDNTKWVGWLDPKTEHGEHLRELLTACYNREGHVFSDKGVFDVVDELKHDLEEEQQQLH